MLLHLLNGGVSSPDAGASIERVSKQNKGLVAREEFNRRFNIYYLRVEERSATSYAKEEDLMLRYFGFLEAYRHGEVMNDIASRARIPPSSALSILQGSRPRLVRLASEIPQEPPKRGCLWLPTQMNEGLYPSRFIQVPERISDYKEILQATRQMSSVDNASMSSWRSKYGECSKDEALMYLLGLYVTDASVFNRTTHSASMGIRLSKAYDWSFDVGNGMCYYLGLIGIEAHRTSDTPPRTATMMRFGQVREIHQNGKYNWASENSPVVRWMHRSCLDLTDDCQKKKQTLYQQWILDAPDNLRRAFLQGHGRRRWIRLGQW